VKLKDCRRRVTGSTLFELAAFDVNLTLMAISVTSAARTDVGRERDENQDAWGSVANADQDVFIVCDGLGGYRGGATASKLAVEVIKQGFQAPADDIRTALQDVLVAANKHIFESANAEAQLHKMATTAVVIVVDRTTMTAHLAHVGDSRAYLIRGKLVKQITRDHTMVQRLVDEGVLEPEAAKNHPHSNVISRSVGGSALVEVEHGETIALQNGDQLILCSDGLHGLVEPIEIAEVAADLNASDAVGSLVDIANSRGGHDNITALVVQCGERDARSDAYRFEPPAPVRRAERQPLTLAKAVPSNVGAASTHPDSTAPPQAAEQNPMTAQPTESEQNRGAVVLTAVLVGVVVVAFGMFIMLMLQEPAPHGGRVPEPLPAADAR
jgi:serine/threonine protein phosphatase PrpC